MSESLSPQISIAVCTRNRSGLLRATLNSLKAQSLPFSAFEILVIDNGSTDDTAQVVDSCKKEMPNLHYFFEAATGLSRARNAAIGYSRTDLIGFIDDDAEADRGWVESILRAFKELKPTPACVGGRTTLKMDKPCPSVFKGELFQSLLAGLDWGDTTRQITKTEWLVGANIAFDKRAVMASGGMNEKLGRTGECLLSGEEILLIRRIQEAGLPVFYEPGMTVCHYVQPERLTWKWMVERSYWQGFSDARLQAELGSLTLGRRAGELLKASFKIYREYSAFRGKRSPRPIMLFYLSRKLGYLSGSFHGKGKRLIEGIAKNVLASAARLSEPK